MQQLNTDTFYALADPSRRQMLQLLLNDSLTINALVQNFDMSRPAVSKHIKILHLAGFIAIEDVGRERYCVLNQQGFNDVQNWMNYYDGFWKAKVGNLERLLDESSEGE